jgi:hypothetical protein
MQNGQLCCTKHKAPRTLSSTQNGKSIFHLNAPDLSPNELQWWRAILAPGRGWNATIRRHEQTWPSPWTVEADPESIFSMGFAMTRALPTRTSRTHRDISRPLGCSLDSLLAVAYSAKPASPSWRRLIRTIYGASKSIFPPLTPGSTYFGLHRGHGYSRTSKSTAPASRHDHLTQCRGLLRSGFYEESIHSLSSGQWLQPAIISRPNSSALAAEVGCTRTPHLAKWWIGMATSGMLVKKWVADLVGSGMWVPNLAICVWTRAMNSYFVKVSGQDVGIEVNGSGRWATVSRAEEVLVLFATSGNGPQGRLMNPSVCPWRPPGDVLLERSTAKVIEMAHAKATIRLYYTQ